MIGFRTALALAFSLAVCGFAAPATAAIGPWVQADHVRLRLIANAPTAQGDIDAAIEITLDDGWKTYWRTAGDAGVPPRLDFTASQNAGLAEIAFPPPQRFDDGYAISNIYHGEVTLPVRLKAPRPGEPVILDLSAFLGVCQQICIPVQIHAALQVPASGADAPAAALIAEGRSKLPSPEIPGKFDIVSVKRVGGSEDKPQFEAKVQAADADDVVLFVETPSDWYPDTPKRAGAGLFRFEVDRKGSNQPILGAGLRLTLVDGQRATERRLTLDAAGSDS